VRHVNTVHTQALVRAAELAGGVDALAEKLAMSRLLVRAWVNGTQAVPSSIFLRIVDLLVDKKLAAPPGDQRESASG